MDLDSAFFQHPLVRTLLLPVVVAFFACGLIRLAGGAVTDKRLPFRGWGPILAASGVPVAFLGGVLIIAGTPPFPPLTSVDKLPYAIAAGLLLGLGLDSSHTPRRICQVLIPLWGIALVIWLAWPRLLAQEMLAYILAAVMALGGSISLWRLQRTNQSGLVPPLILLAAATVGGVVAYFGASQRMAQLFIALTATLVGYILWNWPKPRFHFGNAALIGAGGGFIALVTVLALYTDARPAALLLLLPIFFADSLLDLFRLTPQAGAGWLDNGLGPVLLLIFTLLAGTPAMATAIFLAGNQAVP